jgi:hypothetical protein
MSVPVVVLYIASFLATCLLAAFARHNRTSGYVRQRTSVIGDLIELQGTYDEVDRMRVAVAPAEAVDARVVAPKPAYGRPSREEETEFTNQLVRLHLGADTSSIRPAEQKAETVAVK